MPADTLVLFLLAGENMRARYEAAMADVGVDMSRVDLRMALPGAGSRRNARYVLDLPGPGTRLERLARKMGARPVESYAHVILASYSAGYGAVREVLEEPASARRVSGYCAIDSVHDGLSLARLDWLVTFADRARDEDVAMTLAYTDVQTPQRGAGAYSSTTQVAEELCRRLDMNPPEENRTTGEGLLVLESYDHHSSPRAEHSGALTSWGAVTLAELVGTTHEFVDPLRLGEWEPPDVARTSEGATGSDVMSWQIRLQTEGYYTGPIDGIHGRMTEAASVAYERADRIARPPVIDMAEYAEFSLALRGLAWMGFELGLGVKEQWGRAHDPRILSYSRHCRRGGQFLGVDVPGVPLWVGGAPLPLPRDEDAWCAAYASAALLGSLLPGDVPPHGLRVSVRELVEDAREAGTYHDAGSGYEPQPGDRAIYGRAGQRPDRGGQGHITTVVDRHGDVFRAIGGNERDAIRLQSRSLRDELIVGWIALS